MSDDRANRPSGGSEAARFAYEANAMAARTTSLGKRAATVSILATLYFVAAAIATNVLSSQYDMARDYISDYAVGPWGWIYGSAFWASCIGCLALAVSLAQLVSSIALSRIGLVLLVFAGLTYAIDFLFPTDILPPGAPPTTIVGTIHLVSALFGWVLFTVGAILLSSRLRRDDYWKRWHMALTSLAWLSALLLVVLVAVVVSRVPFGGVAEKVFIFDRNIWMLLVGVLALYCPDPPVYVVRRSAAPATMQLLGVASSARPRNG